jgi:hypothetical protein
MRKIISIFCILITALLSNAQESKWSVSFTPAIVQSPALHYGIQPGFQYAINDRLSLLTEIAFTLAEKKDSSYLNSRYFRIKPELRYTLAASKRGLHTYAGIQLSYTYRKWSDQHGGGFFDKELYNDSLISYSKADINSPMLTSSFQFGTLFSFGDHLSMDIFMGMGIRVIFSRYSDITNVSKKPYLRPICKIVSAPDPAHWVYGIVTRFHSDFGFRLLYRL